MELPQQRKAIVVGFSLLRLCHASESSLLFVYKVCETLCRQLLLARSLRNEEDWFFFSYKAHSRQLYGMQSS